MAAGPLVPAPATRWRPASSGVAVRGRGVGRVLADLAPLVVVLALVWAKLVYMSVFVRSEWWSNEPSIGQWMRPTLGLLDVLSVYPQIAAATLASLLVLFAPVALVSRGRRVAALLGANVALTLLGLADLLHVRFYGDVISGASFTTPRMVRDILPSIVDLAKATNPIYGVDIVLGLLLVPLYLWAVRRVPRLDRRARGRAAAVLLGAGLLIALPLLVEAWRADDAVFSPSSPRIEVASVTGLLPYHLLELVNTRRFVDVEGQRERVRRFLAAERERRGPPSPLFGAARGLNVILVSAESLQAFPLGLVVNGQPVMPRLTALARESLYFSEFHDQTYLGTTSDAQFAVLNGLHPQPVGFVAMDYADNAYRALPAILAERGYATLAAVAAPSEFWNAERLHPRYGFQRSYFEDDFKITERIGPWLADHAFFGQLLPILTAAPQPFLAFLFSSSNHHPFDLPPQYRTLDLGDLDGTLLGKYLHSVHLFDQAFGAFVDRLREDGLLDRSVLVLYGDHQGFLGDPPELGQLLGLPEWGEYERIRVRKRVPLLIRLPHGAEAGERTVAGGHLDVAPTILGLLGVEDDGAMLGRDLLRARDSLVVFRDGGFTDGAHYFVQHFGSAVAATCYQADSGRPVNCADLEVRRREARERLEVSDAIVQGNLIPSLRAAAPEPTGSDARSAP